VLDVERFPKVIRPDSQDMSVVRLGNNISPDKAWLKMKNESRRIQILCVIQSRKPAAVMTYDRTLGSMSRLIAVEFR